MLTTLGLCLGFASITAYAIWLLSRESRDAGRQESRADQSEEESRARGEFDKEMDRPPASGSDLVRRMREWSGR